MLYDHKEELAASISIMQPLVNVMTLGITADERNKPIYEVLRAVRDHPLQKALGAVRSGKLDQAADFTIDGLKDLILLYSGVISMKPRLYPIVLSDKNGEYEEVAVHGKKEKNYNLSIEFPIIARTVSGLEAAIGTMDELAFFDVDIEPLQEFLEKPLIAERVRKALLAAPPIENIADRRLSQMFIGVDYACAWHETKKNMSHPNHKITEQLRTKVLQLKEASGGGLLDFIIERLDPAEALNSPPLPEGEDLLNIFDKKFAEIYALLVAGKLKPLKNTEDVMSGSAAVIRMAKDNLRYAKESIERETGFEFPLYQREIGRRK